MNDRAGPTTETQRPPAAGFMGRGQMLPGTEKAKDFRGTIGALAKYMSRFWSSMVVVLVFALASTAFAIVSPRILGNMTNQVVDDLSKGTGIDFGKLERIALILIALYLLSTLFAYIQAWIMSDVSQNTTYNLRRDISKKIKRLPLKYFDSRTHGDVLSRVANDVDLISQTLNQSLAQAVTSVMMIVGIVAMMFSINWLMTLVTLLMLPLSFGFIGVIVKKSQKHFKNQQATLGRLNGHIEEMYSGHSVMKVFNGEKRSIEAFAAINTDLYNSAWKSQFLSGLMMPVMFLIGNLAYVGVCVLGGWLAIGGAVKIGDIQAFIQYLRQFNQPIQQAGTIANVLQSTAAAAERVFELLGEEEEVPEAAEPVVLKAVAGKVEFDNVVFGYGEDKTIIKGFSAKIQPGQRVALVGPTGAGKTTMVNLLMRFYDVNRGSIKIDEVDVRDMRRSDLRKTFGMVLQDTWLFNGTIEENIAYGNLAATDDEIIAAATAAHADHFIRALPGGYQMVLNEEADNVSQGEKQLLTIARAMLADPPILILDEATSSVDTRTELLIQKAMEKLMEGRTSFVIAHRLSTVRDADLILVMDDGNIVEQGNHEELLAAAGFYASLYNSQFTAPVLVGT